MLVLTAAGNLASFKYFTCFIKINLHELNSSLIEYTIFNIYSIVLDTDGTIMTQTKKNLCPRET